jgi:hypothetical protein
VKLARPRGSGSMPAALSVTMGCGAEQTRRTALSLRPSNSGPGLNSGVGAEQAFRRAVERSTFDASASCPRRRSATERKMSASATAAMPQLRVLRARRVIAA